MTDCQGTFSIIFWSCIFFFLLVSINFQALKGDGQKMNSYLYIRSLRSFNNFSAFVVLQSLNLGYFNNNDISNISATYFFLSYLKSVCMCVCVFQVRDTTLPGKKSSLVDPPFPTYFTEEGNLDEDLYDDDLFVHTEPSLTLT